MTHSMFLPLHSERQCNQVDARFGAGHAAPIANTACHYRLHDAPTSSCDPILTTVRDTETDNKIHEERADVTARSGRAVHNSH